MLLQLKALSQKLNNIKEVYGLLTDGINWKLYVFADPKYSVHKMYKDDAASTLLDLIDNFSKQNTRVRKLTFDSSC